MPLQITGYADPAEFYKDKSILVCGGAGFIGSHIVDTLCRLGASVTVIDPCLPETGGGLENLAASRSHIEWIKKPVEEVDQLISLLHGTDWLIDAMGFSRHHEGLENPRLDLELNYLNHMTLIEALFRRPTATVYLGSRGQYGKLHGCVTEASPQLPLDPQGINKTAAESLYRVYSEIRHWKCLSVRIGNCFGPRQLISREDLGLVGNFIHSILSQEIIELYGDEKRTRHLIYVKDLVNQVLHLLPHIGDGFSAINLVGMRIPLKNILDTLIELAGQGSYRLLPFPDSITQMDPGEGEISQELLRHHIGEPYYTPLKQALDETLHYFRRVISYDLAL